MSVTDNIHQLASASRQANIAYHLVPEPVWQEQRNQEQYRPEAFDADGFIHLTLGLAPLLDVANRYYTGDPRQYRVLIVDMAQVIAEVRYDDPDRIYPHIYGLLNTDVVIGELGIERDAGGRFLRIATDEAVS